MQPDPTGITAHSRARGYLRDPDDLPLTQDEFEQICADVIAENMPSLFAIFEEFGEREDARLVAWGLDFPDYTEVASLDGNTRVRVESPAEAEQLFHQYDSETYGLLIWCDPDSLP